MSIEQSISLQKLSTNWIVIFNTTLARKPASSYQSSRLVSQTIVPFKKCKHKCLETVRRHEADKEATTKESVAVAVKSLEVALESKTLTNQTIRDGMQSMITCLSNFYTLEKTLKYMTSSTELTAK
ncbi:hypothetical protein Bca52824_003441 [Brassica carinata]|uniref:Uncharacterized protein n=1 Tax=Brassica carinata TaxID=52824 RepID=A0A8X7WM58_BRACI|nr:hypothetical protein Bca52824_003441 [Brassica carinata]